MTQIHEQAYFPGIPPALLPHYPDILQDIWEMGSWPGEIIAAMEQLRLPDDTRAAELGCGKGGVMLPVARRCNFPVHGVDAFAPFLNEAESRCRDMGLEHLCTFSLQQVQSFVKKQQFFDVVIFAAVGPFFGTYARTISQVRKLLPIGGYLIIDDGYLTKASRTDHPGYGYYRNREETIAEFQSQGDTVISQRIIDSRRLKRANERCNELMQQRSRKVLAEHPELSPDIEEFLRNERKECAFLESETTPAIWVIQRTR